MSTRIREAKGDITILDIDGRIDINSSEIIEAVGWFTKTGRLLIILNLENVDLVDYNGISVLAIAYKNIVNHKGRVKFINVPNALIELLRVVRLDAVFDIYTDEKSAINSFSEEEVEKINLRRRFKRLDIHIAVNYSLTSPAKSKKTREGNILNMSAAGIFIYAHETLPVSTEINLKFVIPDTRDDFKSEGKVIWLADKQLQPHIYPGMGVAFLRLDPDREKQVIDFIDRNISYRASSQ